MFKSNVSIRLKRIVVNEYVLPKMTYRAKMLPSTKTVHKIKIDAETHGYISTWSD